MKKDVAEKILVETEKGYDLISGKFSQTRKNFWASLEFIGAYVKDGDNVFDFGCGNGRLFEFLSGKAKIGYWGADVSGNLIDIAKSKYPVENARFSKLDPSQDSLALEDGFFNTVYSIAVFHHIPGEELRAKLVGELLRIMKPDGHVVVTVWNLWQKKYFKAISQNWKNKLLGKSELDWNDCYISFTDNQGKVFQRFHRAFTKRELKKLFEGAGFETERCEVIGGRNIVYIGKRI
ncbi:MAG: Protein CBR-ALKB-8 [Candidatus Moranbacteria bacterium GW2011_GWE2_47_10]|nr:MAG: Protein CBR-ALKB-8 [Candidatus Moranbacteria bacterium GW2011_GWE2_47_10]